MTPEQEAKLNEVYEFINQMKSSSTIPLEHDQAIRQRLGFSIANSTKAGSSETQHVDEAGSLTYTVLPLPDGYLQVSINNTIYYIPFY